MGLHNIPPLEKLFIVIWGGLIIASIIFMSLASPTLKRKARPFFMIGVGAIFLAFAYLMGPHRHFWIVLLAVPAIIFLNLHTVRFCGRCGLVNRPYRFFRPPHFCLRCGAPLD
jgi:hypothetical protein